MWLCESERKTIINSYNVRKFAKILKIVNIMMICALKSEFICGIIYQKRSDFITDGGCVR